MRPVPAFIESRLQVLSLMVLVVAGTRLLQSIQVSCHHTMVVTTRAYPNIHGRGKLFLFKLFQSRARKRPVNERRLTFGMTKKEPRSKNRRPAARAWKYGGQRAKSAMARGKKPHPNLSDGIGQSLLPAGPMHRGRLSGSGRTIPSMPRNGDLSGDETAEPALVCMFCGHKACLPDPA